MNRTWQWLRENAAALQGLAALLVIVGSLIALPTFLGRIFQPDVLLRMTIVESMIPPDLAEWISIVDRAISLGGTDSDAFGKGDSALANALGSVTAGKLGEVHLGLEKMTLELLNQSEAVVSGAKLRIDNVLRLWGADAEGTFLTTKERTKLIEEIEKSYQDNTVVISNLPALPSEASLKIVLYGIVKIATPNLSVTGHSSDLRTVSQIEDSWLVDLYRNPWVLVAFLLPAVYLGVVVVMAFWSHARKKAIEKATPSVLYDAGCRLAVDGKPDKAMTLLTQAVDAGYSNFTHARKDSDLENLRNREDFRELFSAQEDET